MSINVNDKNIGHATAYAYYKAGGGMMTEAEFTEFMADFGTASQTAVEAAESALNSKTAAQTAATTATNKASEATTAAQTTTTKAGEAQTSAQTASSKASEASQSASQASGYAQTAETAKTDAQTAKTQAETARDNAVTAKTAAETAQGKAENAQEAAEDAAESVSASAAQIATNTADITDLKEGLSDIQDLFITDITSLATTKKGYIDATKNFASSSSWLAFIIPTSKIKYIDKAVLYTNNVYFYAIAFYSSNTLSSSNFISGHLFKNQDENTFNRIKIPSGATVCVLSTRTVSSTSHSIKGVLSDNVVEAIETLESDTLKELSLSNADYVRNGYISATGDISATQAWRIYEFDVRKVTPVSIDASVYSNSDTFCSIAFYNSISISSSSFISGIKPQAITYPIDYKNIAVPNGTKVIAIATRRSSGTDETASVFVNYNSELTKAIYSNIINSEYYRGELKAIYSDLTIANDITFVGNELWGGQVINDETNETIIHRYRLTSLGFVEVGTINTDFGHLNCMDYNAQNDCLIFGNGSNGFGTEGNWFAVVKSPLSLGDSASLADNAIVYNVDVGFKVQALWGDSNLGSNNVVYLVSNNAKTITKILLLKDGNGDFTGSFTVLETNEFETGYGIGGGKYWSDKLYLGYGEGYNIAMFKTDDYSVKTITKNFYKSNGTEYAGSTQGLHIDKDYIWMFVNSTSPITNYLLQYYR